MNKILCWLGFHRYVVVDVEHNKCFSTFKNKCKVCKKSKNVFVDKDGCWG